MLSVLAVALLPHDVDKLATADFTIHNVVAGKVLM
jgi:hypothetical protein